MKTRLFNAYVLTMVEGEEIIKNGEIDIEDGKITYVGPIQKSETNYDEEIDCVGNLLMPGFKNAHTHSGMSVLRSLADDLPLDKWLNESIFPVEAKMTPEDIYEMSKISVMEYLSSGITACFDMYLTPDSIAKCMEESKFRCVQTGGVNNFSQSPELLEEWFNKYNEKDSLNSFKLGFHAEYTSSKELMEKIAALANKYKAPVYVHLSETENEVNGCVERYGMTPLKFMDSLGMFNYGGGIYHGVFVTDEEMDIMIKRNMYVITNPSSNAKLASGIAPISKYLSKGIKIAIGTDGPASNNCLDMFREMFLVTALAKLKDKDASSVDALEVLKMATVNGAYAMGLDNCDVLAPGKYADIVMLDLNQPNMQPLNNIRKNIVYSGSKLNVKMTMINGRILYKDYKYYLDYEPEAVYRNVEAIKERIIGK